jgi:hypothetical protein
VVGISRPSVYLMDNSLPGQPPLRAADGSLIRLDQVTDLLNTPTTQPQAVPAVPKDLWLKA